MSLIGRTDHFFKIPILKKISHNLETEGFVVYTHTHLPSNDGGVAIGQIIIANAIIGNSAVGVNQFIHDE